MSNHLPNGTVLPHGLLGIDFEGQIGAFNSAYKNTSLRMGIVKSSYSINDSRNFSKLTTEYDVVVLEQNENVSYTNIIYRNCICAEGMGSIADYFEKNLRYQINNQNKNGAVNTTNQDGAIVLVQCIDSFKEKAIIVGSVTHPDREITLIDSSPRLGGEYNGVNIVVNPDGSTSLTFKGATDNNGDPVNPTQGNTVVQIATDGSFSIVHSTVTFQLERSGTINISCTGPANIIAQGTTTIDGSTIKLGQEAVQAVVRGNDFAKIFNNHTHLGNLGAETSVPLQTADPSLSSHVFTE